MIIRNIRRISKVLYPIIANNNFTNINEEFNKFIEEQERNFKIGFIFFKKSKQIKKEKEKNISNEKIPFKAMNYVSSTNIKKLCELDPENRLCRIKRTKNIDLLVQNQLF